MLVLLAEIYTWLLILRHVSKSYISVPSAERYAGKKPTMPHLSLLEWKKDGSPQELRLIEEVAKNWRKLGSAGLGMREAVLNNLEEKHDDVNSCRKLFNRFLENGAPNFKTPTWSNLIKALEMAEMNEVATTLREALS